MRWFEGVYIFLVGFFSCIFLSMVSFSDTLEFPIGDFGVHGLASPTNYITEQDIIVRDDMIIITVANASISRYAASGSMQPTLDYTANGIRIVPRDSSQINEGDIITFEHDGRLIVHRVVQVGVDLDGTYFVTKGDNNDFYDGKVRFSDIKYITIGILY